MPAGANDDSGLDRVVGQPRASTADQRSQRRLHQHARLRSFEQVVIELTAADAVADDAVVVRIDGGAIDDACAKASHRLKGQAPGGVVVRIQFERVHDVRRNPAGADLVAREARTIDNENVDAGTPKRPRAARAARSAADDQDFAARCHGATFVSGNGCAA